MVAAFGEEKFRGILAELTEFTDYLHELTHDINAPESEKVNRMNYMELVLVLNDLADLRRLLVSLTMVNVHSQEERTPYASAANANFAQLVGSSVGTKTRVIENGAGNGNDLPSYLEAVDEQKTKLTCGDVELNAHPPDMTLLQQRVRSMGLYKPARKPVWVEWRSYRTELDHKSRNLIPVESNVRRVKDLVALFHSHKLKAFRVPECLGYIDYREDVESGDSHHQAVFGLAFDFPEDAVSDAVITGLGEKRPSVLVPASEASTQNIRGSALSSRGTVASQGHPQRRHRILP